MNTQEAGRRSGPGNRASRADTMAAAVDKWATWGRKLANTVIGKVTVDLALMILVLGAELKLFAGSDIAYRLIELVR